MTTALVIGAGPAGLMAADVLSAAGVAVTLTDQMPSVGRKFLMAGKSGLNLTKREDDFAQVFAEPMSRIVAGFGPAEVELWANALGQDLFVGSTGRVFPKVMKASPLLRAWLARLGAQGVTVQTGMRWDGWDGAAALFRTPDGSRCISAEATVLALGGASWRRLGSDGAWVAHLPEVAAFRPANMGFRVDWTPHMPRFFGQPVKATELTAGRTVSRGEWVITRNGIEGGGVYEISAAVRDGAPLLLDLLPDATLADVQARIDKRRPKSSRAHFLKQVMRLPPVKAALFQELSSGQPVTARMFKALPIRHHGPLSLDGAISTAGGLQFSALTPELMLRDRPGVFAAGEMLDWEAPTGGYLITGCLATGRLAAQGALRWLAQR